MKHTYSLWTAVLVPATTFAHPGHGASGGDWSLLHYLTEPYHVGAIGTALVVVAGLFLARAIRARRQRRQEVKHV
jgi:hypothetical protein